MNEGRPNLNTSWKKEKKNLDREEKKLGKIADKNTKVIRDMRTKALNRHK